MDTSVIIETSHLTKAYDGHVVVKDLSFQIREGETFGFLGPNGAGAFSRGMKQRLGIAEVLIKEPKIIFFDEPTLGLDPDGAIKLIELIQSLNRERHITVLLSSHHLHHVQKISHRVGIMISGSLVAQGTIHDLAREKFGIGEKEYSLEEVYMKYFQEA
ncbi:MAG: hypothetical protein B1H13_12025 [Desulfobacteraceae bacterium 4484_190.3]|nr:MAG: hypothetical protein B1H13_12025 [Desulfobacteraceae bacterium 4484_190.3]